MALYRANPSDGVAWITGASSGIGRSLALDLAREGYTVAATARTLEKLAALAADASDLPGRVIPYPADVTDEKAMAAVVAAIEEQVGPIVLAVLNAGGYLRTRGERLDTSNFLRTYETNLLGVLHGLVPVVDRMRQRGRGHVAIVASVSGYFGWPSTAAYGSSKAALTNMAESLKYDFDRLNIRIQVINPGFIDTSMTQSITMRLPALMPVDKASRRIVAGLKHGGFETTFPRRFTWFLKALRIAPQPLRHWLVAKATRWEKQPMLTGKTRRS
ncbi:SDR family NAD(P)-dependent oxidoreductase [Mesorhizobium sp. 1B3]|uniref:SDR family NAD(P)-dependent oxidoreductase n=1 Tax=Mesorhizobium sp. 1B3 TaxID=3243599 RepID=UPI003D981041